MSHLVPVYDRDAGLVAWFDGREHLFDIDLSWLAFISGGHVWSVASGAWLGPYVAGCFFDRKGKPVGWVFGACVFQQAGPLQTPSGALRPLRPPRPPPPIVPTRPVRPGTPVCGWSQQNWVGWTLQK